jgi:hypothetical protein
VTGPAASPVIGVGPVIGPVIAVEVDSVRTLPGWLPRLGCGLLVAGICAVLLADGLAPAAVVVAFAAGMLGMVAPASLAAGAVLAIAGVGLVTGHPGEPFRPEVLALVPLCHLLHVLSAHCVVVPARARVHPAALRLPLLRWLAVQAVVLGLIGVLALVPQRRTSVLVEVSAIVALAGLLAVAVTLARRRDR